MILKSITLLSQSNIHTLKYDSLKDDFSGMNNIIKRIKNVNIVALGEGTHGTKEFNEIRSDISKKLITKHNFKIIAFESSFGDLTMLNEEINSDKNIRSLMKTYLLSIWQTEEIESLLYWIRDYNKKSHEKVIISGIDFNYLSNNIKILKRDNLIDNNFLSSIEDKALYIDSAWVNSNNPLIKLDMNKVVKNGTEGYFLTKKIDSIYNNKLNINSKIALYNLELGFRNLYESSIENESFTRDYIMSEMIKKIQNEHQEKIIIFAHNGHIALKSSLVDGFGSILKKEFGDKYYALATLTGFGSYSATSDRVDSKNNKFKPYKIPKLSRDFWEYEFSNYNKDFFMNFNKNFNDNKKLSIRLIGYNPIEENDNKSNTTEHIKLMDYFDGVIFIKKTNPSVHF